MHILFKYVFSFLAILSICFILIGSKSYAQENTTHGSFVENLEIIGIHSSHETEQKKIPADEKSQDKENIKKPSHIISVNVSQLDDETEKMVLNELSDLKKENTSITYYENMSDLPSVYLFLYDTEKDRVQNIKDTFIEKPQIQVAQNRKYNPAYTPNDSNYSSQWYLSNIKWPQAMDIAGTPSPITLALIDNGLDIDHQDLDGNIWVNTGESSDGADNDGNGYVDDIYGCNIYKHRNANPLTACEKANMNDSTNRHGSYVGMIMAAETNNNYGISSVCPYCRIMVLDVDDGGGAYLSDIVYTMDYAVTKQAKIINFSYVSACPFAATEDVLASSINAVVNTYNIPFVQAAGNNGGRSVSQCLTDCPGNSLCTGDTHQEAYYYSDGKSVKNKITVAATNMANQRASFSHYDVSKDTISIAAPGQNITVMNGDNSTDVTGTSFAAPQVSGGLGLFAGVMAANGTSITSSDMYTFLRSTADIITTDKDISGKKINLYTLIQQAQKDGYPVYRFWSDQKQGHFYTISSDERDHVIKTYANSIWKYEGIAYNALVNQASGTKPVYRFWSDQKQGHFYTISEEEKDHVIATYDDFIWRYEGVAFYVYPLSYTGSAQTVYRFWSDTKQHHFYTASQEERDYVINTYDDSVWRYEGEAWKIPG